MQITWNTERLKQALRLCVIPDRLVGAPLSLEEQTGLVLRGGASSIQVRDKEMQGRELLENAERILALCRGFKVPCFVNDRLDVALACGADGVHLGQSDLPVTSARRLAPNPFIIGASARTVEEARRAEQEGADYLGIGAVFPTGSKNDATVIGLEGLKAIREAVSLPIVAIGGISAQNLDEIKACGADGAAVISAAVQGDPESRVRELKKVWDGYTPWSDNREEWLDGQGKSRDPLEVR